MNIITIIQARTGSSRLPGKVMLPLAGKPLLLRMVERVSMARTPMTVVVATTTDPDDTDIRLLCNRHGIPCYSGDPYDLLDRHYRAALLYDADVVVKIPSDCPLIDPAIIDRVLSSYITYHRDHDYVSNLHPATYPDGNDVEVMPMPILHLAWREATRQFEREHTTPFLWEQPERFRIGNVLWESGQDFSMSHRWTIDYPEDYQFIRTVYDRLYSEDSMCFGISDILALLDREPELSQINAEYTGVNWYRHHLGELKTIDAGKTRAPQPRDAWSSLTISKYKAGTP
ncbi:MAG: glycosyltransferase family protein [Bacteroidetes bacterium]|nr:glycosyltransferase family protein [Bacteroidota bacterium]